MTRFQPIRAGIINMWDYRDEEFCFADGWLILRGPNGSGKTKALEVLFPFVLDGRIDPKRLNPFAAEDRTMKSNLLFRGGERVQPLGGYPDVEHEREQDLERLGLPRAVRAAQDQPAAGEAEFLVPVVPHVDDPGPGGLKAGHAESSFTVSALTERAGS